MTENMENGASEEKAPEAEVKTDPATGVETDNKQPDLFEKKEDTSKSTETKDENTSEETTDAPDAQKEEESKDEPEKEDQEKAEEEQEEPKSLEEMGYGHLPEAQRETAAVAAEMGVSFEMLTEALDEDGKFDTSKLPEEISARDKTLLKAAVEAEYVKLQDNNRARRAELEQHAGGAELYQAMVDWANAKAKADTDFRAELTQHQQLMKLGGLEAELATKALFNKFKADPSSELPDGTKSPENVSEDKRTFKTKRDELDAGWAKFTDKHSL